MSFRQFGGLQFAPKNNIVGSNYNSINNLQVTQNIGQPNSYINFLSDISGNLKIYGTLTVSENLSVNTLDTSGDVLIGGNLDVLGTTNLTGATTIDNNLNVLGSISSSQDCSFNNVYIGIGNGNDYRNLVVGYEAFFSNTTGNFNTALGTYSLYFNTTGNQNTAVGGESLSCNTTGLCNTAVGNFALQQITTGSYNVGIGTTALSGISTTGISSCCVAIGCASMENCNGSYNVAVGHFSGAIYPSFSYNTFLGANTDATQNNLQYSTAIGYNALVDASNIIMLGGQNNLGDYPTVIIPGNLSVYGSCNIATLTASGTISANYFNTTSDYRIKENITKLDDSFTIDNLNPVTYKNKFTHKQDIGLIAHELQEYYPFLVDGEKDGINNQSVNYIGLIGILINEIKGLKREINLIKNNLKNKIDCF